jgi:hypothetical protein
VSALVAVNTVEQLDGRARESMAVGHLNGALFPIAMPCDGALYFQKQKKARQIEPVCLPSAAGKKSL